MSRRLIPALLLVIAAIGAAVYFFMHREPVAPEPGVSLALAQDRAARVSSLRYDLTMRVPARKDLPITGHLSAAFVLSDRTTALSLDFAQPATHLTRVEANGNEIAAATRNGHIVLPPRALLAGENTVDIEFVAGDESLNRNDDFPVHAVRAGARVAGAARASTSRI